MPRLNILRGGWLVFFLRKMQKNNTERHHKKTPSCLSTPWVLPKFLLRYHSPQFRRCRQLLTTHMRAEWRLCHRQPISMSQARTVHNSRRRHRALLPMPVVPTMLKSVRRVVPQIMPTSIPSSMMCMQEVCVRGEHQNLQKWCRSHWQRNKKIKNFQPSDHHKSIVSPTKMMTRLMKARTLKEIYFITLLTSWVKKLTRIIMNLQ